jgi:biotin transporter BioY
LPTVRFTLFEDGSGLFYPDGPTSGYPISWEREQDTVVLHPTAGYQMAFPVEMK